MSQAKGRFGRGAGLWGPMIVAACVVLGNAEAQGPAAVFRAGAAAIDITPPWFPISVNGGMADRMAHYAHDRLHARCLVLDDGKTRLAIVVCDSCMIPREIFDEAKSLAEKATAIPAGRMLMSATHTHTAPTSTGVFQSDPDWGYRQFLPQRISQAVQQAALQLEPAQLGWAVLPEPKQVFNRRWRVKAEGLEQGITRNPFGGIDRVRMNPPFGSPLLDQPAGPIDPGVSVLSVQSRDGRPIALLANYSLHYVGRGIPAGALSADYFGQFAQLVEPMLGAAGSKPPFVGILSNGTSGDINNVNWTESERRELTASDIRAVAHDIAEVAAKAEKTIRYRPHARLVMAEREIELGVRLPTEEDIRRAQEILARAKGPVLKERDEVYARETVLLAQYPPAVRCKLQALRIGELGITAIPCEVFVEIGLAIKEKSPLKPTFTIELANGYNGYLPTPEHHALGGYETWRARSSYLEVGASPRIVSTLLELLDEVSKE